MNITTLVRIGLYIGVLCVVVGAGALGLRYLQGDLKFFVVESGSMQPTLAVGSVIFTVPTRSINVGDMITYHTAQGTVVTHRVAEVLEQEGQTMYVTKGDANKEEDDALVAPSMLIGKVSLAVPEIGKVLAFSKTLPGYILFVIVPGLYLLVQGALNLKQAFSPVKVKTA